MTTPLVSVIIPAINEAESIERSVRSAIDGGALETIVVDGGSTDPTAPLATAAGARVLHSTAGRAHQQNVGAAAATGDVLLFLHADNTLGDTAIAQVARHLAQNPRVGWGAMRQKILAPPLAYRLLEWGNAMRVRWRHLPFGDQAIFVRSDLFRSIGGFPDQPLMEDLILSERLRRFAPPALIAGPVSVSPRRWQTHGPWRQTLRNLRLQWRYYRGASPAELASQYRRHDR